MAEENQKPQEQKDQKPPALKADVALQIAEKIGESESILIAVRKDPTIDELAAAIGFCHILDKMGKHGTAIFSGRVPSALEFLNPGGALDKDTSGLQDFIIALSKDKADHLRYKVDGDYVKIFITPYKTSLSEKDLEYSHGDYNVDLVIALDVPEAEQLDAALAEHGKILHNATTVNITNGVPGKFGEIEWSSPGASSVAEMLVELVSKIDGAKIDQEDATALLAGIIAATDGFKSKKATADTFMRASEMINAGADQTVIAENISKPDTSKDEVTVAEDGGMSINQEYEGGSEVEKEEEPHDPTQLSIARDRGGPSANMDSGEMPIKPFAETVLEEDEPKEAEGANELDAMVEAEKAKHDVPGPMAVAGAGENAEKPDFAKQMESELNEWVGNDGEESVAPEGAETPALEGDVPVETASEMPAPDVPVEQPVEVSAEMPVHGMPPEMAAPMDVPVETAPIVEGTTPVPEGMPMPVPGVMQQGVEQEGGDADAFVMNRPKAVIEPIGGGLGLGMSLPPVAPLADVAGALADTPMPAMPGPIGSATMAPAPTDIPVVPGISGADGMIPPPPPPPMPDTTAFQIPGT